MSQPNAKDKKNDKAAIGQLAKRLMPGGVNSPVRAFGSIGSCPRFIKRGDKALIWDEEGKSQESAPHARQILWVELEAEPEPYDLLRRKEESDH